MKLCSHHSLLLALALVIRASSRLSAPNDVNLLSSVRDDIEHKDLGPRDGKYDQAVQRGQAFMAQFNSNQYSAPITGGNVADSRFQGWKIVPIPPPWGIRPPDPTLKVVLKGLVGRRRTQYYLWDAEYEQHMQHAHYRNHYGPRDGVIVALNTNHGDVSAPMSNWSEISWRIWVRTCEIASVDPKTLKYIIRHAILNRETRAIIQRIYREVFPDKALGGQIILLPSGRTLQGFQALLGSPNGRGTAWMLLNKRNILGKTIAKITVEWVKREYWDMWFELQDVVVVAPSSEMTE